MNTKILQTLFIIVVRKYQNKTDFESSPLTFQAPCFKFSAMPMSNVRNILTEVPF